MDCKKCLKKLKNEDSLKCTQCQTHLHYFCWNLTQKEFHNLVISKPKWKCPSCKSLKKASSPQITLHRAEVDEDLTQKSIVNIDAAGLIGYIDSKFASLSVSLSDFKTFITDQLTSLTKTVETWEQRIQVIETKTQQNTDAIQNDLTNRNREITIPNSTISQLEEQLNTNEQFSLRNELEITGLPETQNENLLHLVTVAATKIGVKLNEDDIDLVTRVGPQNSRIPNTRARPIVVRFLRNNKRNDMLTSARARRNLSSTDLEIQGTSSKLYLNERLTKLNRKLFRDARIRAKQNGFRYCWVKHGSIYARKEDQKSAKQIRTAEDIDRVLGPASEVQQENPTLPGTVTSIRE